MSHLNKKFSLNSLLRDISCKLINEESELYSLFDTFSQFSFKRYFLQVGISKWNNTFNQFLDLSILF